MTDRLRQVEFRDVSHDDDAAWETGTIVDLLENIPYLLALRVIPGLRVLNDVLSSGGRDAGMSGAIEWRPLELQNEEWGALAAALKERDERYEYVEPPDWVTNFDEWYAWQFELRFKVPAQEHVRLLAEDRRLQQEEREASARGDIARAEELHAERYDLNSELADYIGRYLNP